MASCDHRKYRLCFTLARKRPSWLYRARCLACGLSKTFGLRYRYSHPSDNDAMMAALNGEPEGEGFFNPIRSF